MTAVSDPVEVALPLLVLTLTGENQTERALARAYWDHTVDERDRPVWSRPVKDLAAEYRGRAGDLNKRVAQVCVAVSNAHHCTNCGNPLEVGSRAELVETWWRKRLCGTCLAERTAANAAAEEATRRRREVEAAERAAYLAARYPVSGDEPVDEARFAGLPVPVLLALGALLPTAGGSGLIGPVVPWLHARPVDADEQWMSDALVAAGGRRVLLVHPESDAGAFVWETNPTTGMLDAPRWHPLRVTWYVPGSGSVTARADHAAGLVAGLLERAWVPVDAEQMLTETQRIVVAEAARFFQHALDAHHLPPVTAAQRTVLEETLTTAAEQYSLGQCYAMVWAVSKDGSAAKQRHPGMALENATTAALNRLTGYVRQAITHAWDLNHFTARSDMPLALTTTLLFDRLLGLDPMRATPEQIRAAVVKRRRSMDADEQADDLIRRGLELGQIIAAVGAVEKVAAALLPLDADTGAGPGLGDAAVVASRLLAGFSEVIEDARESGVPVPEAFRVAYHGLGYARFLHAEGAVIAARCREFVRAAVVNRLDVERVVAEVARPGWPFQASGIDV